MTAPTIEGTAALEAKIDALTDQVALLTAEAAAQRRQREVRQELTDDVMRIAGDAMQVATRELATLAEEVDIQDLVRLLRRLAVAAPTLERSLELLDTVSEFAHDASPLTGDAMALATVRLAELDEKGYFDFARAGIGVVDRIVTGFSDDDVAALGDNVVAILNTVKEITQPEMLVLLQRMIEVLNRQQGMVEAEPEEPPGMWALLKQMRDPDVRRGISRALATLASVSAETGPPRNQITPTERTIENPKGAA